MGCVAIPTAFIWRFRRNFQRLVRGVTVSRQADQNCDSQHVHKAHLRGFQGYNR